MLWFAVTMMLYFFFYVLSNTVALWPDTFQYLNSLLSDTLSERKAFFHVFCNPALKKKEHLALYIYIMKAQITKLPRCYLS